MDLYVTLSQRLGAKTVKLKQVVVLCPILARDSGRRGARGPGNGTQPPRRRSTVSSLDQGQVSPSSPPQRVLVQRQALPSARQARG